MTKAYNFDKKCDANGWIQTIDCLYFIDIKDQRVCNHYDNGVCKYIRDKDNN